MSFSLNSVTSAGQTYQDGQQVSASGVSSGESNAFGNLLAKAISRCFADSIASYEEKQEAVEEEKTASSGSGAAPASFQMSESMDAIFQEAANTYGVSVNLLKAVGMAESNFNPNAQSGAGAQGVMQLMPATAASLGVTNPFDARQNIMGGAKLLAQNLSMYGGNVDLALAAYNAGPGNVAAYGGVPPFAETQNYVVKVKQYMGTELTTGQTVQTAMAAPSAQAQTAADTDKQTEDTGMNFLADAVERVRVQGQMV
ncbi:MAG: lytic transglycosylase domain-containing protein [Lachnospiraceae bacterium]|nr:lytic transglycosylase domain-containing protein [Lachnospiraceae bacterium]